VTVGIITASVLACLSAVHLLWVARIKQPPPSVIPEVAGRPLFVPTRLATLAVALMLAAAAAAELVSSGAISAPASFVSPARWATAGVALAFAGRAVGDLRTIGLLKRVHGTAFARADDRYFVPLCLGLALASGWVAAH
jgi:hypothetical protein